MPILDMVYVMPRVKLVYTVPVVFILLEISQVSAHSKEYANVNVKPTVCIKGREKKLL